MRRDKLALTSSSAVSRVSPVEAHVCWFEDQALWVLEATALTALLSRALLGAAPAEADVATGSSIRCVVGLRRCSILLSSRVLPLVCVRRPECAHRTLMRPIHRSAVDALSESIFEVDDVCVDEQMLRC